MERKRREGGGGGRELAGGENIWGAFDIVIMINDIYDNCFYQ